MNDKAQAIAMLETVQRTLGQKFLSDAELAEQFQSALETAKQNMERDGYVTMVFLAHLRHRETDEWILIPIMFADWPPPDGKKYEVMFGLGAKLAQENPDYMLMNVVQIAEAWMAQYHEEDVDPNSPYMRKGIPTPSEKDDRVECVIVDACSMDQRKSSAFLPFDRDADDNFKDWREDQQLNLYKPGQPYDPEGPRNWLMMQMYMGNLAATKKRREQ